MPRYTGACLQTRLSWRAEAGTETGGKMPMPDGNAMTQTTVSSAGLPNLPASPVTVKSYTWLAANQHADWYCNKACSIQL